MNSKFKKMAYNTTGIEFLISSNQGFYRHHTECMDPEIYKLLCELIVYLEDKWIDITVLSNEIYLSDIRDREIYQFIANIKSQMDDWNNEDDSFSIDDCIIIHHSTVWNESILISPNIENDDLKYFDTWLRGLIKYKKLKIANFK